VLAVSVLAEEQDSSALHIHPTLSHLCFLIYICV